MTTQSIRKIDYREYPECMFAMISAFLPEQEGRDLRRVSGGVLFRSTSMDGRTYRNGLLHSYNDEPAINEVDYKVWYKHGVVHRGGDKPAVIESGWYDWVVNGNRHREGGNPAVVGPTYRGWYIHGELQKETTGATEN
jgi:hypothetical protein